jgi:biopolymer transport protein TolR
MRPSLVQRLRSRRTPDKRNPPYCRLHPSGLAHAALGLVLPMFLVTMMIPGISPHHWSPVDLARVAHSARMQNALRDDAVKIYLTKDGSIYFRNQKVQPEGLSQQIRDSFEGGAERRVYLAADARARYGDVEAILDEVRASGIRNLALLAESP